jgi:hypothetical protein
LGAKLAVTVSDAITLLSVRVADRSPSLHETKW